MRAMDSYPCLRRVFDRKMDDRKMEGIWPWCVGLLVTARGRVDQVAGVHGFASMATKRVRGAARRRPSLLTNHRAPVCGRFQGIVLVIVIRNRPRKPGIFDYENESRARLRGLGPAPPGWIGVCPHSGGRRPVALLRATVARRHRSLVPTPTRP